MLYAGPSHFERYDTVGLRGAVARVPAELRSGASVDKGRAELRSLLQRQIRGEPALLVSSEASWTLKAFAAGYARNGFKLALLWQIYSRRCCVSIQVRQYGHRRGLDRMMRSTMACRTAGNVG